MAICTLGPPLAFLVLIVLICVYYMCCRYAGESVSVVKHTDVIPDPKAVNQDKKNMLFSVSAFIL